MYDGVITSKFLTEALEALSDYKLDKEPYLKAQRDNDRLYKSWYSKSVDDINNKLKCTNSLVFSAIENAVATANENYPMADILERDEDSADAATALSKIVPVVLEYSGFKKLYKANMRSKHKHGTAFYCVTCNEATENVDIRILDFCDVYFDMHVDDVQDSKFLFILSAIDNEELIRRFPEHKDMFQGDAAVDTLEQDSSFRIKNSTVITDCYYKRNGSLHLMKICDNEVIAATEDMPGYENGLYDHGLFPIVVDRLYPIDRCPLGFGMIDIAKSTQLQIDKLNTAITENIMINSRPRYLAKRNGGIDEAEFRDISKNVVHYEGETGALVPIIGKEVNAYYLSHRDVVKDELKELLANRDFQQGTTMGGVTAASAIQVLQQAGEKRSRLMSDDSYDAFRDIVYMVIELIRQFYNTPRSFRFTNDRGRKSFISFSNAMLKKNGADLDDDPAEFDIDIVPQKENPFSREAFNNTILTLWQSGMFNPDLYDSAKVAISSMQFDGKEKLLGSLEDMHEDYIKKQQDASHSAAAPQSASSPYPGAPAEVPMPDTQMIEPLTVPADDMTQQITPFDGADMSQYVQIPITGGM